MVSVCVVSVFTLAHVLLCVRSMYDTHLKTEARRNLQMFLSLCLFSLKKDFSLNQEPASPGNAHIFIPHHSEVTSVHGHIQLFKYAHVYQTNKPRANNGLVSTA